MTKTKTKAFSFRILKWRGSPGKAREEQANLINACKDRVILNERRNSGGPLAQKASVRTAIFEVSNGNEVYFGITADPADRFRQMISHMNSINSNRVQQTLYRRLRECGLRDKMVA